MREEKTLYVVVPCYKEEAVLPETAKRLKAKLETLMQAGKISPDSRILFVNDGSRDKTWDIIAELHAQDKIFSGVNLSRNRGHQNALVAGLFTAVQRADIMVSMDADLQDDINAMDKMIDLYHDGNDIVYGVRSSRKTDSFFKRFTAEGFYRLMKLMGVDIVFNHADYRLMSRRAVEGLLQFEEVNLFLRGVVPQVGFRWATVEYERAARFAGESKYPLKKMIAFAVDGITSFSVKPLRLISSFGIIIALLSVFGLLYALISHILGVTVPGWTAIVCSIWLLGGIQLFCVGIVGVYVGKIYNEVKQRPRFRVETYLEN